MKPITKSSTEKKSRAPVDPLLRAMRVAGATLNGLAKVEQEMLLHYLAAKVSRQGPPQGPPQPNAKDASIGDLMGVDRPNT